MSQENRLTTVLVMTLVATFSFACAGSDYDFEDESSDDNYLRNLEEGETLYEAENYTSKKDCKKKTKYSKYTGKGYMDFGGKGAFIEWNNIEVDQAGEYRLTFRYANGRSSARRGAIVVNGKEVGNLPFSSTSKWKKWKTVSIQVLLTEGENLIRVMANSSKGGPNLDHLVVTPQDLCLDDPEKVDSGVCGCGVPEGTCGFARELPYHETFDSVGGSFQCTQNICTWTSDKIETSGVTKLKVTADLESYSSGAFENSDYLNIYYSIDEGSFKTLFENSGEVQTDHLDETVSINGGTIQIMIEAKTSASDETYEVDDLIIEEAGDLPEDTDDEPSDTGDDPEDTDDEPSDTGDEPDPSECKESKGCFQIVPTGTSDDSIKIQSALDEIEAIDGGQLLLKGNFVIAHTIYLPSNLEWFLDGKISLSSKNDFDKVIVEYKGVTNTKRTAITDKENGATNIFMTGGTYDGRFAKDPGGKTIRFLSFANVTQSKFHDMIIENTSDDCFTLHVYSKYNEVRNMTARKSLANGLNDKGEYNKWYDSLSEDHESDGITPKCSYSEFHRVVARGNKGPGWGMYARIDGNITKGAAIVGNKFIDCEAYDNVRSGMSFNIAEDRGPGAVIADNYVSGKFYNNGMYGVLFRNKEPDGVVRNNEVDILAFGNKGISPGDGSKKSSGSGLKSDGEYVSRIKGTIVSYDNSNLDMDLNNAENCSITVYIPDDQDPAELKTGSSTNEITEETFSCQDDLTTWSTREYCSL